MAVTGVIDSPVGNPELGSYADTQVLQAAPDIMANANTNAVQELAGYLGSISSSARAHELLLQITERSDNAAMWGRICLTWHPQPEDLSHLAAVLITPGDADPHGTDRSSLPYSLVKAYGDNALPYLERAVAGSPYVWVRVESAEQLVLHNRPIGFQFLSDQLVRDPWSANRAYKPQLIQWVRDNFPSELPRDASEDLVTSFLRGRLVRLSLKNNRGCSADSTCLFAYETVKPASSHRRPKAGGFFGRLPRDVPQNRVYR
jgi:hypothetical protein